MSPKDICPIMVSEKAPDIALLDVNGNRKSIVEAMDSSPALIIFYRGGWCPYCNTHLADLRKIEKDILALGIKVIAISPDQPKFLVESKNKHDLHYTLLSDSKMEAASAFGLAYKVDADTLSALKGYNIDLKVNSGESHEMLPVPAAILVDKDLVVRFTFVAPDYTVRADNDVILAAARAMLK